MPIAFGHVSLYVTSNEFLMYYLEVEAATSCEITICCVDDIDLEARKHRRLRVHAGEHALIGPSTGNCFLRGITMLLGEQLMEVCGAMLRLRWYLFRDVLDVELLTPYSRGFPLRQSAGLDSTRGITT